MALVRSHRTFGYEIARMPDPLIPGKELALIQTKPGAVGSLQVEPAHLLMPASDAEVILRLRVAVESALADATFLGASIDAIRDTVVAALDAHEDALLPVDV